MFEKDAEEYSNKAKTEWENETYYVDIYDNVYDSFKDGAEFGYNKANEWHYVSEKGTPTKEGHYLVCLRNKDRDILDCWILFDKDIGWYSLQVRLVDIYAWKEIVLPKEIE